jgi:hypothetical protein
MTREEYIKHIQELQKPVTEAEYPGLLKKISAQQQNVLTPPQSQPTPPKGEFNSPKTENLSDT